MRHIPLPLPNGLITKSVLEPSFLRVDISCKERLGLAIRDGGFGGGFWVCLRNSVRLMEFGSGVIQVEGL